MMTSTLRGAGLACALVLASTSAAAQTDRIGCLWDRHADSPVPRFEAGTIPIDGKLYAFGGFFTQSIAATARVDAYDPQTDTWTQMADMPEPTTHVGFVLEGRRVWVIGGFVGNNPGPATANVWIYDIDANTWSAGPALTRPIAGGGATLLGGRIHYYGGCEADRNTVTGDHWVLDLANQGAGWQPLASMPEPRCHHSAAVLAGELWAIGGQYNHDINPTDTRWVHVYDPLTDTWRQGPLLPEPKSHFEPATFVANGMLYIAGGKDLTTGREILADMLELDPLLGVWSYLPPLPNARYGPGAQLINGRLYAANGAALSNNPQPDLYSRDWNATFPNPFRINCGGPEVMSANGSYCWCGDIGYAGGEVQNFNPQANIFGTEEDAVFHKQRAGRFTNGAPLDYRFPMGNGIFRVKFIMAERQTSSPGVRVMSLSIEGETLAENVDLALDPGFEVMAIEGFDVAVTDGALDISLMTPPGQRPMVAALEIERLPNDHFSYVCPNGPNSGGGPAEMDFVGTSSVGANDFRLLASPVPNSQFGLFVQGANPGSIVIPNGGELCIGLPFFRLPVVQAQSNLLSYDLDLQTFFQPGAAILPGTTWRFQAWFRDPSGPLPSNLSNLLELTFTP